MKNTKRNIMSLISMFLVFISIFSVNVQGATPTDTFTHNSQSDGSIETVTMRPIYEVSNYIKLAKFNSDTEFGKITDIKSDKNGNLYILTAKSEILILDKDFNLTTNYEIKNSVGENIKFDDASGLYVSAENEVFIADTKNSRVLCCRNGIVFNELLLPDSNIIPEDFIYQPIKICKDSKGYIYVLSEGSYYGALLFDPNYEFVGFYGANTVKGTVLSTLSYIWDALTQNDVKRAKKAKTLPYQFVDICVDNSDFVYTCTGKNSNGAVGQIRMLSPGGSNILTGAENKNFGETEIVIRRDIKSVQNFTSIKADDTGFIYTLDTAFGIIYVYDNKSNLIGAFGGGMGNGKQIGTFSSSCSLEIIGTNIIVSDSLENSITVFKRTDFGKILFEAQALTLKSDYISAKPIWEKVLKLDEFNNLAYAGLAKAFYDEGDFAKAKIYSKNANDKVTYSLSLKEEQNNFISNNWTLLFLVAVLLVGAITFYIIYSIKKHIVLIKNKKLHLMATSIFHPFQNFTDIKYKGLGSLPIAISLTLIYFLTNVISVTMSDFRYTTFNANSYSSILEIAKTVGIILLWTLSNWAVSILVQGKGKFKEVFIISAYSVWPLIIANIVTTPLSHIVTSADSAVISGITGIAMIITGILLCIGLMTIHEFTFTKVLITAAVTIIFMIFVVFVIFMLGILLSRFWSFITSVILEVVRL